MVKVNVKLFCPNCGARIVVIAYRKVHSEDVKGVLSEIVSERWKKTVSQVSYGFGREIMFVACARCEKLYMYYYDEGHHFDFVGKLTDEVSAMILTCFIEVEGPKK